MCAKAYMAVLQSDGFDAPSGMSCSRSGAGQFTQGTLAALMQAVAQPLRI